MRYYYKDNNGCLYNLKNPNFIKYKEVDGESSEYLDENGEKQIFIPKCLEEDGLLDGYTQITEEEFNQLSTPKQPTGQELLIREKRNRIKELKTNLSNTDYKAIKYAEGELTEEEYEPVRLERRGYREEINKLEDEVNCSRT